MEESEGTIGKIWDTGVLGTTKARARTVNQRREKNQMPTVIIDTGNLFKYTGRTYRWTGGNWHYADTNRRVPESIVAQLES